MGRRTHEAIGRPLRGRHTIVLSRTVDALLGVDVVAGLDRAVGLARGRWPGRTIFVAGGGEVWRSAWSITTRLEITAVHQDLPGTVTFPEIAGVDWIEDAREPRAGFDWVTYHRRAERR